jgi:hypothetical protein
MQITLISGGRVPVDFLSPLARQIRAKIGDAEVDQAFVPTTLDIPLAAQQASADSDLVFVFVWAKKLSSLDERVLAKVMDIEIATNVRIIKAWGAPSVGRDKEAAANALAVKWADFIVRWITDPSSFRPGGSESDLDEPDESDEPEGDGDSPARLERLF